MKIKRRFLIEVVGLNQNKLLQNLCSLKIAIKNYVRLDNCTSRFVLDRKDFEHAKKVGLFENYKVKVADLKSLSFAFLELPKRLGFVIGLLFAITFFLFSNNFIYNIEINGATDQQMLQINQLLEESDIRVGALWSDVDLKNLEAKLFESVFLASNVRVDRKGGKLEISMTQQAKILEHIGNIVSEYDAKIESIEVSKGYTTFSVGDIVKMGDVLVYADDEGISRAQVSLRVFRQSSVCLSQFKFVEEKTGNKIVYTEYIWPFAKSNKTYLSPYERCVYERVKTQCFSNLFFPMLKIEHIYWETSLVEISENDAIELASKKALELATCGLNEFSYSFFEHEMNGEKFIDCFAEAVINLI